MTPNPVSFAALTVNGASALGIRYSNGWVYVRVDAQNGTSSRFGHIPDGLGDVAVKQPLVALNVDPKRLYADLSAAIDATGNGDVSHRLREVSSQVAAQLPTRPVFPEPQGLGAVAVDSDGDTWVRSCPVGCEDGNSCLPWSSVKWGYSRTWGDIEVAEVKHDGWNGK